MADREGRQSFRKGSINQEGAVIVQGVEAKIKASAVFTQNRIPPALFPLATIEEFGFNSTSGLFWMKQKAKSSAEFAHAELVAMYAPSLSGAIEKNKIKNLKGFKIKEMKGRELYLSVPYDEIIDDDEVRLRSAQHATRNCMLISFSDHPPPPRPPPTPAPEAAPPPEQAPAEGAAPQAEGEGAPEGEASGDTEKEGAGEAEQEPEAEEQPPA